MAYGLKGIEKLLSDLKENEDTLLQIIKNLYCFGCDLDEIKKLLKAVFYTRN